MSASAVSYPWETWKAPTLSSVPAGMVAGLIVTVGFRTCWPLSPWNTGENVTACEKPPGAGSLEQKLPVVTLAGMPYWARSLCSVLGSNSTFGSMVRVAVPFALRVVVKAPAPVAFVCPLHLVQCLLSESATWCTRASLPGRRG